MIEYSEVKIGDTLKIIRTGEKAKVIGYTKSSVTLDVKDPWLTSMNYHGKCGARRLDYVK